MYIDTALYVSAICVQLCIYKIYYRCHIYKYDTFHYIFVVELPINFFLLNKPVIFQVLFSLTFIYIYTYIISRLYLNYKFGEKHFQQQNTICCVEKCVSVYIEGMYIICTRAA